MDASLWTIIRWFDSPALFARKPISGGSNPSAMNGYNGAMEPGFGIGYILLSETAIDLPACIMQKMISYSGA